MRNTETTTHTTSHPDPLAKIAYYTAGRLLDLAERYQATDPDRAAEYARQAQPHLDRYHRLTD